MERCFPGIEAHELAVIAKPRGKTLFPGHSKTGQILPCKRPVLEISMRVLTRDDMRLLLVLLTHIHLPVSCQASDGVFSGRDNRAIRSSR